MDKSLSSYISPSQYGKAHHTLIILSLLLFTMLLLSIFNTASAAGLKKPKNLSPHGNGTELQPDFSWKPVVGSTEYLLRISQDGKQLVNERISSAALGCAAASATICTYSPTFSLVLNKWVRWRVRAFDATQQNNHNNWSNTRWYRVKKPAAPKAKTPDRTINDSTPAYSWRGVESANSYELIIRRGRTMVFSGSVSAAAAGCADSSDPCAYTPDATLGNGNYRWRVRGVFDVGNGKWSNFRGFKVRDVAVTENQAPVAESQSASTDEDASVAITLSGSDADSDALTFSVVTQPANGSLSGTAPNLTYTPTTDFNGTDSFTFIANDGEADSAEATVSITVNPIPEKPLNVTATAGNAQVQLNWNEVADADSYAICLAEAEIVDPVNCTTAGNAGIPLTESINSLLIDDTVFTGGLENGTEYFFVVLAVANVNGSTVYSAASTQVTATPQGVVEPTPTGRLNDTGITTCGNYTGIESSSKEGSNNQLNCFNDNGDWLTTDGTYQIPAGQDGHYGRDVTGNDPNNGHAGFNFTKIDATGGALAANATEWSCVKDNVTGLIWEVKTDGGLHDKDTEYSWYQTLNDGGYSGDENSINNTSAFAAQVNSVGLCGATSGWRLPTREELRSLVSYDRITPSIDIDYFPNTTAINEVYWSSSPFLDAYRNSWAWAFSFGDGTSFRLTKSIDLHVRLVRSGS